MICGLREPTLGRKVAVYERNPYNGVL